MTLRRETELPHAAVLLLEHSYRFASSEWQHCTRDGSMDQGFEARLRESFVAKLRGFVVSQYREMNFGSAFDTASGVLHEIDIVARHDAALGILELKNRAGDPPGKNDVVVFFAKILDYLCLNPALLSTTVVPIFASAYPFEQSASAACVGLGVHAVAPGYRPLPLLADYAGRMDFELKNGLAIPLAVQCDFGDFVALVNRLTHELLPVRLNSRLDFQSDTALTVHAVASQNVYDWANDLRVLNGMCSDLLAEFQRAKKEGRG